ncbi:MAG: DUF188 domain-containing protein [Coprobacillus sp.]
MRLIVDGDACPNKEDIKKLAIMYDVEMLVFIDYAHVLEDDYYQVINCEIGSDSVDMAIVKNVQNGDIVITQDYGLAGLVLSKKAQVLHTSGQIIDNQNIDSLLFSRYVGAKMRKANQRTKGPAKRTDDVKEKFLEQLDALLKQ